MYTVRCDCPRGGDAIERRGPRVEKKYESLDDALWALRQWYRSGPNGPVRDADLLRDGVVLDARAECERLGMEPLYSGSCISGCRPKQ